MSDLQEIKGLVEKINPTLVELRSEIDAMKASAPKDVVTEEKHQRMADEITAKMADMQAKQAKLEAALNRPETGDGKGMDAEMEAKHARAFRDYITGGDLPSEFKAGREGIQVKAMSTDVNPDGGYLVRPQFSQRIIDRVFESSPVRQVASVETTGGDALTFLIDTEEASAEWEGQGSSASATTTPQLARKTIAVHPLLNKLTLTAEQIEDSYLNVEGWLSTKTADKFARAEATAFVNGDGVKKPRGFLTYAAWSAAGVYEDDKIEQVNLGAAAALTADGIIKLQNSLTEPYQPRAVWGGKRATFGAALQLKGNDNYFFSPVLMRDGQASIQLLGKTFIFMDDMPAVAANALSLVYGDFSMGYTIVDRVGLQFLRDPFSSKPSVEVQGRKRVGGDVTSYDALKIGKVAA